MAEAPRHRRSHHRAYGDDFVIGFQHQRDAQRFLRELEVRMQKFGLELSAEKTRLIEFGRFAIGNRGFTHICAKNRKDGRFTVKRKTITKRLRRKVKEVSAKLRQMRHLPLPDQERWLRYVIQGYFNYHAVPGNRQVLDAFRTLLARAWHRSLRRRSQKATRLTSDRMEKLVEKWLRWPRILHPYPNQRLCVSYPR